jgi:hypothetical protein
MKKLIMKIINRINNYGLFSAYRFKNSPFWGGYVSATTTGIPNNKIINAEGPFETTYRTFFRPNEFGNFSWKFWHSNSIDSQAEEGSTLPINSAGGNWCIKAAYLADGGISVDGSVVEGTKVQITYGGSEVKNVSKGEKFWSDPVSFNIPNGHYMVFSWTISTILTGSSVPMTFSFMHSCYSKNGNYSSQEGNLGFNEVNDCIISPNLIAYQKNVNKVIGFLGDSITQGFTTTKNLYRFWVAEVAKTIGSSYSIWNVGSGWAKACEAAKDGEWLFKLKQCNDIVIMLGVNDIRVGRTAVQIIEDLITIVQKLKDNSPKCRIILNTIPPFDFEGTQKTIWYDVNKVIRNNPPNGVDWVFDMAAVLSQPAPNENMIKKEYCAEDPHPSDAGHSKMGEAFSKFYLEKK